MPYFEWSSEFDLGDPRVDCQHPDIAAAINELHECRQGGDGVSACRGILGALVDRMAAHFATEEQIFADCGYPDADAHAAEHRRLLTELFRLREEFDQDAPVGEKITQYLRVWITAHVLIFDKAYTTFTRRGK